MEKHWSIVAIAGFVVAAISVAAAIASGFGHRLGWWDFRQGFAILKVAFFGGVLALVLSAVGAYLARPGQGLQGFALALCGIVVSIALAFVPLSQMRKARSVPPIHDITTDTDNPPGFAAVLPLRGSDSNSIVYAGSAIADQQREAYPDIQPLITNQPDDVVFEKALAAAKSLGWQIVSADAPAKRIEATDTTFWFGFKDDVVIRITALPEGARVDVRSISRVGRSDVGANAERIRKFLANVSQ